MKLHKAGQGDTFHCWLRSEFLSYNVSIMCFQGSSRARDRILCQFRISKSWEKMICQKILINLTE